MTEICKGCFVSVIATCNLKDRVENNSDWATGCRFYATKDNIEVCLECGKPFVKKRKGQRFCPAKPGEIRSKCQNRHCVNEWREKKERGVSDAVI